jgi:NitT/TauT family transport system substrate-binding protein
MKYSLNLPIVLIISMVIFAFLGCKEEGNKSRPKVSIAVPAGSPALTFARVIEKQALSEDIPVGINLLEGPSHIPIITQKEQADFIFMPLNIASKLYNKGVGYRLLNVVSWGALNIVTSDEGINDWEDLKGRELYLFGRGASPDILTRFFLSRKGIDLDQLSLVYQTPQQNAQLLITDKFNTALLPEPVSTMALQRNTSLRVVLKYNEEWQDIFGKDQSLAQAGIMVNNRFAEENPKLVETFSNLYKKEIEDLFRSPEEFGELAQKHRILTSKELVLESYQKLGIRYMTAQEAKEKVLSYLEVLHEFNPEVLGGKVPDDEFFYQLVD